MPTAVTFVLLAGVPAIAGDLNPPAGPVAPTPGPEPRTAINATNTPGDADSVFKIAKPGSYFLTGNVAGTTGKCGIEIVASDVTVDLMGFEVKGVVGSLQGVVCSAAGLSAIEVRNGTVREWGLSGVDFSTFDSIACRVDSVRAMSNGGSGIKVDESSVVADCVVTDSSLNGVVTGSMCVVQGCVSTGGASSGFSLATSNAISGCTGSNNAARGFIVGVGSTVTTCTASTNGSDGIFANPDCVVASCTFNDNAAHGIWAGNGYCMITGCTANTNGFDGIQVNGNCQVINNLCSANGADPVTGAGIHATGSDNRIEGNNCVDSDRGIDIDATGNVIVRNSCSGNLTNWDIVANNVCGPILDRTAPASAAILGNSAPSSLGSTDANANYTY